MKLLLASIAAKVIEKALPLFLKKAEDYNFLCIITAAKVEEGPKEWLDSELNEFRRLGFKLNVFDLDGAPEHKVQEKIENADIIYASGGNTFFLLEKMKACNFEKHIRKALARGAIYIGSSAGAVVCCPDIDYVRTMDDPSVATLDNTIGLRLVDFFVMVHMDNSSFSKKANDKLLSMKQGPLPVVCLKDHEALFVDGASITLV